MTLCIGYLGANRKVETHVPVCFLLCLTHQYNLGRRTIRYHSVVKNRLMPLQPHAVNPHSYRLAFLALILSLLMHVPELRAGEVLDLYEAEVPVIGQGSTQRRAAIREAFSKVLVKVTGNRAILSETQQLSRLQREASRYVQQYRYKVIASPVQEIAESEEAVTEETGTPEQVAETAEEAEPDRLLWVRFDARAVNRMLRNQGLPIWGKARPAVVVWLGVEQAGERQFLQPEATPDVVQAMEESASARGVPVMLPLMDLEDRMQLSISDLWGNFSDTIQRASGRYAADATLAGRAIALGDQEWVVEWTLLQGDYAESWQTTGASLPELSRQGIEVLSDHLAEQFAPLASDDSLLQLQVEVVGIDSLAGFNRTMQYLKSLVIVEQVAPYSVDAASGVFLVHLRGGPEVLEQEIRLGSVLEPLQEDQPQLAQPEPEDDVTMPEEMAYAPPIFRLRPW